MGYYGTVDDLYLLLEAATEACRGAPAGHWKNHQLRAKAVDLARTIHDRWQAVDPEAPDPVQASQHR